MRGFMQTLYLTRHPLSMVVENSKENTQAKSETRDHLLVLKQRLLCKDPHPAHQIRMPLFQGSCCCTNEGVDGGTTQRRHVHVRVQRHASGHQADASHGIKLSPLAPLALLGPARRHPPSPTLQGPT